MRVFLDTPRDVPRELSPTEKQRLEFARRSLSQGIYPAGEAAQEIQVLMLRDHLTREQRAVA